MPLGKDWDLRDRIRAYTGSGEQQRRLREEYLRREQLLGVARECEEIAARYQQIADQIREAL